MNCRNRRIVWTVEWVHKDGSREIGTSPETKDIDAAYAKLTELKTGKAVPEAKHPKKKHRLNTEVPRPQSLSVKPPPEELPTNPSAAQGSTPTTQSQEPEGSPVPSAEQHNLESHKPYLLDHQLPPPLAIPDQHSQPPLHFYLLLPSTPTPYRVLIPILPKDSLSEALTDRLVLEFPTIYALKQPPDKLPTGFMTEEDYLRGIAEKRHTNRHLDGLLNGAEDWETERNERTGERDLDESALRDVLKKDLVREVDAG